MRPKFEETLSTYSALAKDKRNRSGQSKEQLARLTGAIEWHLAQNATRRGSSPEVQEEILKLQEKKQKIMARLKRDLASISNGAESLEHNPQARQVIQRDDLLVVAETGETVDLGSLLTDGDWGVHYQLDPETTPKTLRKKYLVEEAKRKLWELLNAQILKDEMHSSRTHELKRETYKRIQDDEHAAERAGLIAEKMVRNFLKNSVSTMGLHLRNLGLILRWNQPMSTKTLNRKLILSFHASRIHAAFTSTNITPPKRRAFNLRSAPQMKP